MKVNNFKMSFNVLDDIKYTLITFGNVRVTVFEDDDNTFLDDLFQEHFIFNYYLNNQLKLTVKTVDLPVFLYSGVRNIYYGFFAYDKLPFYKSPAYECVGMIRALQNYLKRIGKSFV